MLPDEALGGDDTIPGRAEPMTPLVPGTPVLAPGTVTAVPSPRTGEGSESLFEEMLTRPFVLTSSGSGSSEGRTRVDA